MGVGLYEHQRKAVDELRPGSVLVGGVGTGKSRTALAYFCEKICGIPVDQIGAENCESKHLYIITTARKRDTFEWDKECAPFLIQSPWVTIDSWNNIKKYKDVRDAFFIFDEQRLVGYGAWVKAFLTIAKYNQWILLTATPGDTWMDYLPVFIANGFYRNKTEFVHHHVVYHRYAKFPKVEKYINTDRLEKCRDRVVVSMPFQKQTLQHHKWIFVDYDKDLYTRVSRDRWNVFDDAPIENASEFCYTLRKVVNSSRQRLRETARLLKKHPKAVIFYNFDYELEQLRSLASGIGIVKAEWNGHKHEPLPSGDRWIYLVQYSAGSEGWNCVETDTIIFFSQNYSYRTTIQASGRIDRMNTKFTDLYYYHLLTESSIDRSIRACLKKKKNFNEVIFSEEAKSDKVSVETDEKAGFEQLSLPL